MDATARDKVWAAALEIVINTRRWRFRTSHVRSKLEERHDDVPSHNTIQRTLRAMTELGILSHSSGSPRYGPGRIVRDAHK